MFNNPLRKYQSGGKATPQQQQQIAQLFEAASKNTGIDVETLMNAANELKDENSMKQYVEAISLAAQGDKTAIDSIKKMFGQQPAMQKLGGKIRDFICKHANGKKIADCGCGKNVPKAQNGTSGIPQNASALDSYLMNNMQMPNSSNLFTGQQVAAIINGMHLNQPLVQAQENGGRFKSPLSTKKSKGAVK